MKVTLFSTYDIKGGAARAMYRLHKGLRHIGEDSIVLSKFKDAQDEYTIAIDSHYNPFSGSNPDVFVESVMHSYIQRNRSELTNTAFSYSYPGWNLDSHPNVLSADVLNLHWVAEFQSPETIYKLLQTNKPVVWTLHDEWAFTGGCHYTAGCDHFKNDCSNCPQLSINNSVLPVSSLLDKIKIGKNITVVTPSVWLAEEAKKSRVFQDSRVEVIPYSLETDVFVPHNKKLAKERWNLKENFFTLLFGAESGVERRKGFRELVNSLQILKDNSLWKSAVEKGEIHILLFGNPASEIQELGIPYTSVGHIRDDKLLSLVYSAADLFLLPSLEDNLPNTMLESLSCSTPIVAFACGGMVDLVQENKTGYLAEFKDEKQFATKILEAFTNSQKRKDMGQMGREWMEKDFSIEKQAFKYRELFKELLDSKTNFVSAGAGREFQKENWDVAKKEIAENGVSDFAKNELILRDALSQTQLFWAMEGSYNFLTGIYTNHPISYTEISFLCNYQLRHIHMLQKNSSSGKITQFLWVPMWKLSLKVEIESIAITYLDTENEAKIANVSISDLTGNWQVQDKNSFYFYHSHGMLFIPCSFPNVQQIEISGKWKVLSTWESFQKIDALLKSKESRIRSFYHKMKSKMRDFF